MKKLLLEEDGLSPLLALEPFGDLEREAEIEVGLVLLERTAKVFGLYQSNLAWLWPNLIDSSIYTQVYFLRPTSVMQAVVNSLSRKPACGLELFTNF